MSSSVIRNVIYIHTHDMGRYISPYGHAMPTPHLQQFAAGAALFRQAHCCGPTCSPSRAGLLTGVTPHESGMLGLAHRGFKFSRPELHLGHFLREQGFLTALCGVQHEFNAAWEQMPYEYVMKDHAEDHGQSDNLWTQAAVDFLSQPHDRPFFLSFGQFFPHRPFAPADPQAHADVYVKPPDPLPDTPEIRRDMADYRHTVGLADANIGRVLDTIRRTGRDKDSLIIITTDHGIAFPRMKCNLTAHGTGVTLMMAYPDNPGAGRAIDGLVSHLDVYPTLCDLLGIDPPGHLQGHSQRPLLEGTRGEVRDELFSEVSYHASADPMRSVRTRRFNYIRIFDEDPRIPLANIDDGPAKSDMLAGGWSASRPNVQLYDLLDDPNEACNRAGDPAYQDTLADLSGRLDRWMRETNDPLLNGPLKLPEGAVINPRFAASPGEEPVAGE